MGKTAAGAAISYFVNKALGRLSAEDEDLHKQLTEKLPIIVAVFDVGNQPQVWENQALAPWMWQFRDALQEAEDALDELEYLDLEKQAKDRRAREVEGWKVRLSSRLPDFSGGFRRSLSAVATGGTSKRLKDALKGLDSVLDNAGNFLSVIMNIRSSSSDIQDLGNTRETTRELTTTAVFGRQEEKGELLEWLGVHTPVDTVDHKLLVCAIVGGGGMGKTTLAQFICQDKMVQDHFGNQIVWVHVSKRLEPKSLVRRILESINRNNACSEALDSLQSYLTKQLVTKRFLLVLDDAWEDMDEGKWEQFLGPLRNNAVMGGRILLTTRMRSVAEAVKHQMRVGVKCLELKALDQEDTLKLFNHHAFGNSTPSDRLELRLIGEQIARKLKGCPFVAKVVGQQLRDSTDHSRWNAILNQDIYQFDEIGPTITEMLKMSYQNLTYEVQLCFRYCSIFPPGFKFKMEELIEMWVGSGLILQRENGIKNQEDIARDHFNILVRKTFFSLVPRELHADPSEDYYVMHDLMHELARSVSIEECSRFKDDDHSAETHGISPPGVRHLCIQSITPEIVTIISQSKNLRTLIIENEASSIQQELVSDLKKSIKGRTSLRLLKLHGQGWFGMNDVVAELKHLRYIYMSATDEPNLCKLFKLCHLQVLRIIKIDKEDKVIPIDIGNLPSLQKLDIPKRALSAIPHIGKLTSLRELNGFSVRKKDGHNITELQNLGKLQRIIVFDVQNVSNCNEADAAKLDNKMDMKVLSLRWSHGQGGIDDHILNKRVPHRNLKHLTISRYNGIKPPMWIQIRHLSNLVRLELDGCVDWDKLPPLGSLGALEHVVLAHLPKLKYIGNSSHGSNAYGYRENWTEGNVPGKLPPHLNISHMEHIEISNAELLRSLPSKMHDLYALRSLLLHNTHVLQSLPRMPPNLWVLVINGCCTELFERYQIGGSDWGEINWISNCDISKDA
ncbi:putative disease resistance protein RGA3 [Panicum miliaceum]|uniref:Disease resistance protein RGA3 n=1 Tax=Panicum miliaceum TaxID=4540 RepID=A0A3L6SYF4_PANMI|nr:putative disease resistance protein RGA3 [Panicum miliaceum]